jgi:hypothetical protein
MRGTQILPSKKWRQQFSRRKSINAFVSEALTDASRNHLIMASFTQ